MAESSVTYEDLKKELTDYNYKVLTGGDDSVASRCIEKATIWAKAKVIQAAGTFDATTTINREIVLKRALYELYAFAENEEVARDKKEDAFELLKAAYGNAVDGAGYTAGGSVEQKPIPTGAVKRGFNPSSTGGKSCS